jgi:ribosomal protein L37AE/L43A
MADWAKRFTWAFVPSFLAAVLFEILVANSLITLQLPELRAMGAGALTFTVVRVPLLTILLAVPSYLVLSYSVRLGKRIMRRRRKIYKKNRPSVALLSSKGPPDVVVWAGGVKKYGVLWPAAYGNDTGIAGRPEGDSYSHVGDPLCPECQTELLKRTVPKWIALEKRVWQCPDCGEEITRPRSARYVEKDSVANILDRGFAALANNPGDLPETPFEERNDIITETWEPGTNKRR